MFANKTDTHPRQILDFLPRPAGGNNMFGNRLFVAQPYSFTKTVLYSLMKNVKMGDTVSYKRLAEIAGNDKAARAVGGAMRSNPVPLIIPCHRVICSDGKTGNYSSGKANHLKEWLLAHEKLLKEM
uniref:Methylated-DNA--protein-cysteine methyltransferase n=1 Tax=Leptobrachium leishanense TaxID=445787 RepID=A0A8C5QK05_9ANUR